MSDSPKVRPVLTYILIAICIGATISFYKQIIVFAMASLTQGAKPDFLAFHHQTGIGFIPKLGLTRPASWVTSIFYHAGYSHLFWNMLALWFFRK